MKRLKNNLFLLTSILFFASCSLDEEDEKFHFEFLKVESVVLPDTLFLGQTHDIVIRYKKPSSCHFFNNMYYDKNLNERIIAVQSLVTERNDCVTYNEDIIEEAILDFYVTNNGSYIFKFWQGKDTDGNDLYLEYEIPVED